MRISDWSSDVCSSDLSRARISATSFTNHYEWGDLKGDPCKLMEQWFDLHLYLTNWGTRRLMMRLPERLVSRADIGCFLREVDWVEIRSEEHTSELQSLMRISYAVFCLKKKTTQM